MLVFSIAKIIDEVQPIFTFPVLRTLGNVNTTESFTNISNLSNSLSYLT